VEFLIEIDIWRSQRLKMRFLTYDKKNGKSAIFVRSFRYFRLILMSYSSDVVNVVEKVFKKATFEKKKKRPYVLKMRTRDSG
jgi:hypothetical protein